MQSDKINMLDYTALEQACRADKNRILIKK